MSWKESLSVDVVSIDRAHQELAEAVAAFFALLRGGAGRPAILPALDRLIDMVADHFEHEERVMRNIHLASQATHRALHAALLEEIRELREEVAMGANERPPEAVEHFLNTWLFKHIAGEDAKIRDHLNRE